MPQFTGPNSQRCLGILLKVQPVRSSETSVVYQSTRSNIPDKLNIHQHTCENVKYCICCNCICIGNFWKNSRLFFTVSTKEKRRNFAMYTLIINSYWFRKRARLWLSLLLKINHQDIPPSARILVTLISYRQTLGPIYFLPQVFHFTTILYFDDTFQERRYMIQESINEANYINLSLDIFPV